MHMCVACACMLCTRVCIVQLYVCVSMQFAAAFARMFKKGPFKEVAFNFMSSRQLWEDLWKGIEAEGIARAVSSPELELGVSQN